MGWFKKSEKGHIIAVQEDRFRMVGDSGKGYLFTLFHGARISRKDLSRWKDAEVKILVRYKGDPNLATGIAHEVRPLRKGTRQ